ncbi:MAG: tryptophan 2,3-dioxygenase [Bdellovibrionaceae bacterium]|nr:tryptophan 2,3-dioxygenase [Pseudobdellovibrionaceae bacterium]
MSIKNENFSYNSYLQVENITSLQFLESAKKGEPAHEEMLFIIIHQTYELWFKQIIWELDSIIKILSKDFVPDSDLYTANHRMLRILEIQKILIDQIDVLETMTPLEFLEFRNLLFSASGFQSSQFRLIENRMGLRASDRAMMGGCPYHQYLNAEAKDSVLKSEQGPSLFTAVEKWLERTPYLQVDNYNFWQEYKNAVHRMFEDEALQLQKFLQGEDLQSALKKLGQERDNFEIITDPIKYEEFRKEKFWRLSHKALMAALFIQLYREQPSLQPAFQLITHLLTLDEKWTVWRYRHAQMVLRMLGQKVGTGGSSGAEYLKSATEKHKVFNDFFKLSTFFISSSNLPHLPQDIFNS